MLYIFFIPSKYLCIFFNFQHIYSLSFYSSSTISSQSFLFIHLFVWANVITVKIYRKDSRKKRSTVRMIFPFAIPHIENFRIRHRWYGEGILVRGRREERWRDFNASNSEERIIRKDWDGDVAGSNVFFRGRVREGKGTVQTRSLQKVWAGHSSSTPSSLFPFSSSSNPTLHSFPTLTLGHNRKSSLQDPS